MIKLSIKDIQYGGLQELVYYFWAHLLHIYYPDTNRFRVYREASVKGTKELSNVAVLNIFNDRR